MRRCGIALTAAVLMVTACNGRLQRGIDVPYPPSARDDVVEVIHGEEVADPYRWLEDGSSPAVQKWLADQDALARHQLQIREDRVRFHERLEKLAYIDSISAPVKRGNRYFYTRRARDQEKAVHYWKEGKDGPEQVLLDPFALDKEGKTSVGSVRPSWDGRLVAYTLHENNADEATLYVKDVESGKVRARDRIEGAKYAYPQWTPKADGFYYTWLPTDPKIAVDVRPGYAEVRYHHLGTDPARDPIVYPATHDATRFLWPQLSRDGRWLLVYDSHGWTMDDVYVKDLRHPKRGFQTLAKGTGKKYSISIWKNVFYVKTDDDAPLGRVLRVDPTKLARDQWTELVPEAESSTLDSVEIVGGHLVLNYLENASSRIRIYDLDGKHARDVELPEIGSASGLIGNPDEDEAYYSFSSFKIPPRIYETSVSTGKSKEWARIEIDVDPNPFEVERVMYPSKDGTKISMFIVHRKGMVRDGTHPTILNGYGGFDVNLTPYFNRWIYPWLENGGVFAVANLRGGGEYGEAWHQAGMLTHKQTVFDDFIAAAEWLTKNGYTSASRLAIYGRSNGGLLVGAAMTQRPDLFGAVICGVPLLDMVRYHKFGSGRTWIAEYGSAEDEEQFKALYAYSPYHHVKEDTDYPATLFLSSDADDRVDPMHARKMAAALQHAQVGPRPILLRVERNAGHGGADLTREAVDQWSDIYAFLAWQLGMDLTD